MMMSLVDEGEKSEFVFVPGSGHERDQTSEVSSPREEGEQLPVRVMMSADAIAHRCPHQLNILRDWGRTRRCVYRSR